MLQTKANVFSQNICIEMRMRRVNLTEVVIWKCFTLGASRVAPPWTLRLTSLASAGTVRVRTQCGTGLHPWGRCVAQGCKCCACNICHVVFNIMRVESQGFVLRPFIPYSPVYNKLHPGVRHTLNFALVFWYQVILKLEQFHTHVQDIPHFWCSILGQKGASYTRVDTVKFDSPRPRNRAASTIRSVCVQTGFKGDLWQPH